MKARFLSKKLHFLGKLLSHDRDNIGQSFYRLLTTPVFGYRLCWKCDSVIPSHVSFIEHFSHSHVTGPTSLTSLMSDLTSDSDVAVHWQCSLYNWFRAWKHWSLILILTETHRWNAEPREGRKLLLHCTLDVHQGRPSFDGVLNRVGSPDLLLLTFLPGVSLQSGPSFICTLTSQFLEFFLFLILRAYSWSACVTSLSPGCFTLGA